MNKEDIQRLKGLQTIDSKIHSLKEAKLQKPQILGVKKQELVTLKNQRESKKQKIKQIKLSIDGKDLELKEREAKVNKLSIQLNTAKSNKEYSALFTEINSCQADNSLLEDEILALFSKLDGMQKDVNVFSQAVDRAQAEFNKLSQEVTQSIAEFDRHLNELYPLRQKTIENIDSDLVSHYEKILSHKADRVALAQVVDGVCQGCNMDISPQEINELMKGREMILCRNCSRILYL